MKEKNQLQNAEIEVITHKQNMTAFTHSLKTAIPVTYDAYRMHTLMCHNRRVDTHTHIRTHAHVQSLRTKMEDQRKQHEDEIKARTTQSNDEKKKFMANVTKVFCVFALTITLSRFYYRHTTPRK